MMTEPSSNQLYLFILKSSKEKGFSSLLTDWHLDIDQGIHSATEWIY